MIDKSVEKTRPELTRSQRLIESGGVMADLTAGAVIAYHRRRTQKKNASSDFIVWVAKEHPECEKHICKDWGNYPQYTISRLVHEVPQMIKPHFEDILRSVPHDESRWIRYNEGTEVERGVSYGLDPSLYNTIAKMKPEYGEAVVTIYAGFGHYRDIPEILCTKGISADCHNEGVNAIADAVERYTGSMGMTDHDFRVLSGVIHACKEIADRKESLAHPLEEGSEKRLIEGLKGLLASTPMMHSDAENVKKTISALEAARTATKN